MTQLPPDPGLRAGARGDSIEVRVRESAFAAEREMERSLAQMRAGTKVVGVMSTALFVIGLVLVAVAGFRLTRQLDDLEQIALIGGTGLVPILVLLYRSPLRQLQESMIRGQQAKMTVLGYSLGLRSLGSGDEPPSVEALSTLTDEALERLERLIPAPLPIPANLVEALGEEEAGSSADEPESDSPPGDDQNDDGVPSAMSGTEAREIAARG